MALYQANLVRERLSAAPPGLAAPEMIQLDVIRTTGDRVQNRLLSEIGGKGLFTKEIEQALIDRRVDLAVHSLKDMETLLPAGLDIACVLPRDDPRDVLVSRDGVALAALPPGAKIGTASLRRKAQLLRPRPDLVAAPIRGNVDTRLAKLAAGEVDGLLLALCGLERLGRIAVASDILSVETMLPAVGQGALAIETRADDAEMRQLLAPLHDAASAACVAAERAMLAALDGAGHPPTRAPRSGAPRPPPRSPMPPRSAPTSASDCAATPARNSDWNRLRALAPPRGTLKLLRLCLRQVSTNTTSLTTSVFLSGHAPVPK